MLRSHPSLSLRRRSWFHCSVTSGGSLSSSTNLSRMDNTCLLMISGKGATEKEKARSLASGKSLNLKNEGTGIAVILRAEEFVEKFRSQMYMDSLSTTCFGRLLFFSPSLPSTQDFVSQNFVELPIGAVCVADIQSKGRGRTNNLWVSPPGCLMFSFTIEMENGRVVPLLQYVISLAITEAIIDICQSKGFPPLEVKIKWPNDLYLNGLKVGGVLCTSTYKSKKFNVSAGIGLNLDNEKPTTSLNTVLRGLSSILPLLAREDVLASFFNNFEHLFQKFLREGFEVLEELYYKRWLHSGQRVEIEEELGKIPVTIKGLTKSGYLLATDDDDNLFELHPDGNRLQVKNMQQLPVNLQSTGEPL